MFLQTCALSVVRLDNVFKLLLLLRIRVGNPVSCSSKMNNTSSISPKAQIFFNGDMAILSCYQWMNQGSVCAQVAIDESRSHEFLILFYRG